MRSETSVDDILRAVCLSAYRGASGCVKFWGDAPEYRDDVLREYLLAEASRSLRLWGLGSREAAVLRRFIDACIPRTVLGLPA